MAMSLESLRLTFECVPPAHCIISLTHYVVV